MNLNKIVMKFVNISFSILVILLVVLGLVKLGTFFYDFGYRVFTEAPMSAEPGKDVVVQITADMSEREIGKLLEEKGLIRDSSLFLAQLKLSAYSGDLRPGVYTLNTSKTAKEMMVVMAAEPMEDTEDTETEETQTDADDTQMQDEGESAEDAGDAALDGEEE